MINRYIKCEYNWHRMFTYVMMCPLTYQVRYIGKSANPKLRFNQHIMFARANKRVSMSKKDEWIRRLGIYGLSPIFKVVSEKDIEWDLIDEYKGKTALFNLKYYPEGYVEPDVHYLPATYKSLMQQIRQNSINAKINL